MLKSRVFTYPAGGGSLLFLVNYTNPATGQPFDNTDVTSLSCRVLDPATPPATVLLSTTAATYDTTAKIWKLAWTFGAALTGVRAVIFEAVPTRSIAVSAALWPEVRDVVDTTNLAAPGDAMALTSSERDSVATNLLDLANGVETSFTLRQSLRLMAAVLCGKASGGPSNTVFRDMGDAANRVTSVADANGNRTTVTLTP